MNKIEYKIKFTSDWAILSGKSAGGIDNRLLRDENGFPYIPGKTIKGVFREGYEEIFELLPESIQNTKYFGKVKDRYKGEEISKDDSLFIFSNAEISKGIKEEINSLNIEDRAFVLNEIAYVIPRNKIDDETNMAEEKALAFFEVGRKGIELDSSISKKDCSKFSDDEIKLFTEYLFKYVRRIGALRTRGKGQFIIEVINEKNK